MLADMLTSAIVQGRTMAQSLAAALPLAATDRRWLFYRFVASVLQTSVAERCVTSGAAERDEDRSVWSAQRRSWSGWPQGLSLARKTMPPDDISNFRETEACCNYLRRSHQRLCRLSAKVTWKNEAAILTNSFGIRAASY